MGQNDISDDNPLKETLEDRIEREMKNNFHVLFQIEQRLQDIQNAVEANTVNVEILEEAISKIVDIPARPLNIRYSHEQKKLWIIERFSISFDGKESDVFGLMFFPSSGKPMTKRFSCIDVASLLEDTAMDVLPTTKAIHLTAKRIQSKLNAVLSTRNLLTVTTKEFYFTPK